MNCPMISYILVWGVMVVGLAQPQVCAIRFAARLQDGPKKCIDQRMETLNLDLMSTNISM